MKVTKVLAAAALIASGVAGCASTDEAMPAASPGHELHTFAPGWQRFFTLDWQAGQRSGRPILSGAVHRSEEHTSELQSLTNLVCRLLLEKKKKQKTKKKKKKNKKTKIVNEKMIYADMH